MPIWLLASHLHWHDGGGEDQGHTTCRTGHGEGEALPVEQDWDICPGTDTAILSPYGNAETNKCVILSSKLSFICLNKNNLKM